LAGHTCWFASLAQGAGLANPSKRRGSTMADRL